MRHECNLADILTNFFLDSILNDVQMTIENGSIYSQPELFSPAPSSSATLYSDSVVNYEPSTGKKDVCFGTVSTRVFYLIDN